MSFHFKSLIERDKNILDLENNVFSKLKEISGPENSKNISKTETKIISLEEAIKELLNIKKSS